MVSGRCSLPQQQLRVPASSRSKSVFVVVLRSVERCPHGGRACSHHLAGDDGITFDCELDVDYTIRCSSTTQELSHRPARLVCPRSRSDWDSMPSRHFCCCIQAVQQVRKQLTSVAILCLSAFWSEAFVHYAVTVYRCLNGLVRVPYRTVCPSYTEHIKVTIVCNRYIVIN